MSNKPRQKKIELNEKQYDLFKSLLIAIISGFSVVLFQQLFFKGNVDYELRKEVLKDNYEYYVAIQNFSDLNYYTQYNFEQVTKEPKSTLYINIKTKDTTKIDTTYEISKSNKVIKLPTIAVDSMRKKRWINDKNFIMANKNKVDQKIYLDFLEIVVIVENNPWPEKITYESLRKNIWSNKEFEEEWFEKNMLLHYKAGMYIKLE